MSHPLRKEIKYVISFFDFERIRKRLGYFLSLDPHSGPDGYSVRSLYFDSINNQDLTDVLGGHLEKRKIRLRIYSPADQFVKLEFKCKSGSDGIKKTLRITREEALGMMEGDYHFLADMGDPLARELYMRLCSGAYRPVTVVDYRRKAYLYPASDVRLTYDTRVRASSIPAAFFDEDPALFPLMPDDLGVFEVKYNDFLPGIFKEVLTDLDLLPTANSKYVQSRFL